MKYYKSVLTGKIVDSYELDNINSILGDGTTTKLLNCGAVVEIDPPSVAELILMNRKVMAIKRYREANDCTLAEAKEVVERVEAEMKMVCNMDKYDSF